MNRLWCSQSGFTRIDLGLVVFVVVVVAVMTGYRLGREKGKRQQYGCAENLKKIGVEFTILRTDRGEAFFPFQKSTNDGGTREYSNAFQHFRALSNLSNTWRLVCPESGKRAAASWDSLRDENISYFLGVTAEETTPTALMSGDSGFLVSSNVPQMNPVILKTNSEMSYPASVHKGVGNILFADGRVQQLDAGKLKEALRNSIATNVVLLPRE